VASSGNDVTDSSSSLNAMITGTVIITVFIICLIWSIAIAADLIHRRKKKKKKQLDISNHAK